MQAPLSMARAGWKKVLVLTGLVLGGLLLAVQLVPYGRSHSNPPVTAEPSWNAPATRALAQRACFDCHSNETRWPWYSHVAPVSWLVQRDVDVGRRKLNFSDLDASHDADESAEVVREGEMPMSIYVWMHASARLSAEEKRQLADGFAATFGEEGDD